MMSHRRKGALVRIVLIGMFSTFFGWGCTGGGTFGLLEPAIKALDARLQSHSATISEAVNSLENGNTGILSDASWEAIRMETEDYVQDMQLLLNDLGETVSMIEDWKMMMPNPPDAESPCS